MGAHPQTTAGAMLKGEVRACFENGRLITKDDFPDGY
jgi:hypothetical protein